MKVVFDKYKAIEEYCLDEVLFIGPFLERAKYDRFGCIPDSGDCLEHRSENSHLREEVKQLFMVDELVFVEMI